MNAFSKNKELILASLFAIYCAYDVITGLRAAWGFTTDDAYISWVYARQLVNGQGLLWPGSSVLVEGYSNFLWMLISALVMKLQLPLTATMKGISCFSLFLALIFIYRLGRLFFSPLLAILPVFLFSHYYGVIWWAVSGLETMFYVLLAIILVWQTILAVGYPDHVKPSNQAWGLSNITLLLLSLTRFEGLIWAIPLVVFILCEYKHKRFLNNQQIYIWGAISLSCFVVPYCLYFIWRLYYFGQVIPNSFACKAATSSQFLVVDLDYIQVIIPLIVASLPYLLSKKDCRHVMFWMPSVLYGLMLWNAESVIAHLLRLFMAPFALFSYLPVLGIKEFVGYFNLSVWKNTLITAFALILITCLFIPNNNVENLEIMAAHYQERTKNRELIASLLNVQAKNGSSILIGDCGVIPFNLRPDIRIIDSQCLNNFEMAHTYRNNLDLYVNHLKEQVKPDWVITNDYPLEAPWNILNGLLYKRNFFNNYQLVATFESGMKMNPKEPKVIDYVYKVYKRHN